MSKSSKKHLPKIEIGRTRIRIDDVPTGRAYVIPEEALGGAEVLVTLGGAEVLTREENQFRQDEEFLRHHLEELVKEYPEQWVAIYMGQVVAADRELEGLAGKLRLGGFPLSRVMVDYVTEKKAAMVL